MVNLIFDNFWINYEKIEFEKSSFRMWKFSLFSAIVVTWTLNSIAWHPLTLVSYIPNEFYGSGDSIAHVGLLWPGLANLKIAIESLPTGKSRHFGNGSTQWFDQPSKSIPKFEFSKSTFFTKKYNFRSKYWFHVILKYLCIISWKLKYRNT